MSKRVMDLTAREAQEIVELFDYVFQTAVKLDLSKEALCAMLRGSINFLQEFPGTLPQLLLLKRKEPITEAENNAAKSESLRRVFGDPNPDTN